MTSSPGSRTLLATFGAFALAAGAGALLATAPARAADADDEPTATPYRPSVAGGAYLSRPGWLEVEFGAQRLGGRDTDRRDSLPYLLKLALDERWAVLLGGEARVRLAPQGGSTVSGVGDTVATLKYRAPFGGDSAAYGVEASVKLPTARDALGSGERDYGIKGIYSADLRGGFHLDANLGVTRLGGVDAGQGRALSAWAAAVSHPAGDAWTLALDLSGTAQRGAPSTSQLLGAASYSVSKRVVVDFGAARGLTSATPRWTAFSGVTVLLGQLF